MQDQSIKTGTVFRHSATKSKKKEKTIINDEAQKNRYNSLIGGFYP